MLLLSLCKPSCRQTGKRPQGQTYKHTRMTMPYELLKGTCIILVHTYLSLFLCLCIRLWVWTSLKGIRYNTRGSWRISLGPPWGEATVEVKALQGSLSSSCKLPFPQGHFLRAIALEHLGNYQECLSSYLKTYELDTNHPPELLLNVMQVAGCLSQLSDAEEIDLATAGKFPPGKVRREFPFQVKLLTCSNHRCHGC